MPARLLIIVSLLLMGCYTRQPKLNADQLKEVEQSLEAMKDTSFELSPTLTYEEIIASYEERFQDTIRVDTVQHGVRLKLVHFAWKDSVFKLHERYWASTGLAVYKAPECVSMLTMWNGDEVILDTVVRKKQIKGLPEELEDYGVLFHPNVTFHNSAFRIFYSLSIPLTDVGRAVELEIDMMGDMQWEVR